ncbi:hypothetical protein [uncultured Parabacteroides sp.]
MWDKAKGANSDATDNEPDTQLYGAPFLNYYYWSSYGNVQTHGVVLFTTGLNDYGGTWQSLHVRCVSDIN